MEEEEIVKMLDKAYKNGKRDAFNEIERKICTAYAKNNFNPLSFRDFNRQIDGSIAQLGRY